MKIRSCEYCGKSYEASGRNQKYCSRTCGRQMRNQQKQAEQAEKERLKANRKGLAGIVAEARAAGMSYGKYQAMWQAKEIRVDIGGAK